MRQVIFIVFFIAVISIKANAQDSNKLIEELQNLYNSSQKVTVPEQDSIVFFRFYIENKISENIARKLFSMYRIIYNPEATKEQLELLYNNQFKSYAANKIFPIALVESKLTSVLNKK